jgi:hypothetical protein
MAIAQREERHVAIMVPEGAIIEVIAGPFNGARLMDVRYDGEMIMMFTDDMKTHTELVKGEVVWPAKWWSEVDEFFSIEEGATASTDAVILSGTFKVRIEPRADRSTSRLPALYVDGIEPAPVDTSIR